MSKDDFAGDGTHPSMRTASNKVAGELLRFFRTDTTTADGSSSER